MNAEADLEKRARAGEPSARFELGTMLLTGPRAAADGPRGIALIEEAAASGHAEAIVGRRALARFRRRAGRKRAHESDGDERATMTAHPDPNLHESEGGTHAG